MTDLPQPLTPADCDLRGLPFMPLKIIQVMQSETFGLSTGDEFKAAFALWCASWMEVPAASLPSDDRMLDFLSRSKAWKKVKSVALRGWVLCSDGRLYHPVVADNALEAWDKRTDYRDKEDNKNERQQRWRDQCKQLGAQLRELGITPPKGASLEKLRRLLEDQGVDAKTSTSVDGDASTVDAGEIGKTETVKRQGQLTTNPEASPQASSSVGDDLPIELPDDPTRPPAAAAAPQAIGRNVAISILLRAGGIDATSQNPLVCLDWAENPKVTDELLSLAVVKARTAKPDQRISVNYLKPIVAELLAAPEAKAAKDDWEWAKSDGGIQRKANELGIRAHGNMSYRDLADKCKTEIQKRKGQR